MRSWLAAVIGASLLAFGGLEASLGNDNPIHASLAAARGNDDLRGLLPDAANKVEVRIHASAGSKLSVTLTPDDELGAPATGVSLELADENGTTIPVTGTKADKSKAGKDHVRWKNFPLETTQDYLLWVRVTGPGCYRLKVSASLKPIKTVDTSTEALFSDAEATVSFPGLRAGKVKVALSAPGNSRFKGELRRVEQADGTIVWNADDEDAGPVMLENDGLHHAIFRNNANTSGHWKAVVTAKPGKIIKRVGYVRPAPDGTVFVPKVKKLTPGRGVHLDTERAVTMTGRDFQPGLDVRLERKGFADLFAKNVMLHSETEVSFEVDLDTRDAQSKNSVGTWKVAVTNAPALSVEDDLTTLDKTTPTREAKKPFKSVSSNSVQLPRGVQKKTEVWYVEFTDAFDDDLEAMGLGSADASVRQSARGAVEAYTILFLRDLFQINETTGNIGNRAVPLSFLVKQPSSVAGDPGVDYNRIQVGGTWEAGEPLDPDSQIAWGFTGLDAGNTQRDDLLAENGHGVRTGVLDRKNAQTEASWQDAMRGLGDDPLVAGDAKYFLPGFGPANQNQADRYALITRTIERASREIAAIVAHHVAKAMGVDDGGFGPMDNPEKAGASWDDETDLVFATADLAQIEQAVVRHALPGKSETLRINSFPLNPTKPYFLDPLTTDTHYEITFDFVGGRPNADPEDYQVLGSSRFPFGLTADFIGARGTAPLFLSGNIFYCEGAVFVLRVTDTKRNVRRDFLHRINVLPDVAKITAVNPTLGNQAQTCRTQLESEAP